MKFWKLHGCGNSFVVVTSDAPRDWSALAMQWCDTHFGIGSDGLLVVSKTQAASHFNVSMFNPDGSSMGMCGNGMRCIVRYLHIEKLVSPNQHALSFNVDGRAISTHSTNAGQEVRVDMGEPIFEPALIPSTQREGMITVSGREFHYHAVSMGNPHCVIFDDTITSQELATIGPLIEHSPLFPSRTNVEFVTINPDNSLTVKVWERGAGQTLACGTGACAALVAAAQAGKSGLSNTMRLPGGELKVLWDETNNRVYLTGPAQEICSGETNL